VPETHRLEGSGTIKLPAADAVRDTIPLALSGLMGDVTFDVVAPNVSAGPVTLERKERPFGRPEWVTVVWTIRPQKPFPAHEPVVLRFSYAGGGDRTGFGFYVGPLCSFGVGILTAWYPVLEDQPLVQLRGFRGTGTVQFSVPPGYKTYAVGKLISPAGETERGTFRFRVDTPSTLSFSIARYLVSRLDGPIPVSVHLLQPRPNVDAYLKGSAKVLNALVQEFGPYPYPEFAILEVPADIDAGFSGANADGFILTIGETFDGIFKTAHFGHEISHTWWGAIVQRKRSPRGYYMLDEAMAQFGSLRAVEMMEGPEAAEQYRRTGYPGFSDEYCGFTYLMRAATGFDHTLADLPSDTGFMNARLSDSKGMLAWDLLSRTVGRKLFSRILTGITTEYAYRRIGWDEFLQAIEKGSGQDLKWFYEQWFERTGAPEWQVTWKREGQSIKGVITQAAPYYRALVEVQIDGECGSSVRRLNIRGPRTEFNWPVRFAAKSVTVDPHFLVLHWTPAYRKQATALMPYTKGDLKLWQGQTEEAIQEFKTGLARIPEPDEHGLRFLLEYGLARAFTDQQKYSEAREHILLALQIPIRPREILPWAYVQLATIAQKTKDQPTFELALDGVTAAEANAGRRTGAVDQALTLKRTNALPVR
jgi:tetratricopeptide (TPR) repeat protein